MRHDPFPRGGHSLGRVNKYHLVLQCCGTKSNVAKLRKSWVTCGSKTRSGLRDWRSSVGERPWCLSFSFREITGGSWLQPTREGRGKDPMTLERPAQRGPKALRWQWRSLPSYLTAFPFQSLELDLRFSQVAFVPLCDGDVSPCCLLDVRTNPDRLRASSLKFPAL